GLRCAVPYERLGDVPEVAVAPGGLPHLGDSRSIRGDCGTDSHDSQASREYRQSMPPENDMTVPEPARDPVQSPVLTDDQWARLRAFGEPEEIEPGDYLFRTGQRAYNLMLIESGEVEIVREPLAWVGEVIITTIGPRSFLGELGLLNGQAAFLSARVTAPGVAYRVSDENLHRLMA